jgi:hypothetical protein
MPEKAERLTKRNILYYAYSYPLWVHKEQGR